MRVELRRAFASLRAVPRCRCTSSGMNCSRQAINTRTLRNAAIELRNRFPRAGLTELPATDPELWAKESYEIATKIAYQNGALRGTPRGKRRECREVTDALVLPKGYASIAKKIADRRMMLAGYRLVDLLQKLSANAIP